MKNTTTSVRDHLCKALSSLREDQPDVISAIFWLHGALKEDASCPETDRDKTLRQMSLQICERRTQERDIAMDALRSQALAAEIGKALLDLVDQLLRLRQSGCFVFNPRTVVDHLQSELQELALERDGSLHAREEAMDVLTVAINLAVIHGTPLIAGLRAQTQKLQRRLDRVDGGESWEDAKRSDRRPVLLSEKDVGKAQVRSHADHFGQARWLLRNLGWQT